MQMLIFFNELQHTSEKIKTRNVKKFHSVDYKSQNFHQMMTELLSQPELGFFVHKKFPNKVFQTFPLK